MKFASYLWIVLTSLLMAAGLLGFVVLDDPSGPTACSGTAVDGERAGSPALHAVSPGPDPSSGAWEMAAAPATQDGDRDSPSCPQIPDDPDDEDQDETPDFLAEAEACVLGRGAASLPPWRAISSAHLRRGHRRTTDRPPRV